MTRLAGGHVVLVGMTREQRWSPYIPSLIGTVTAGYGGYKILFSVCFRSEAHSSKSLAPHRGSFPFFQVAIRDHSP